MYVCTHTHTHTHTHTLIYNIYNIYNIHIYIEDDLKVIKMKVGA